MQFVFPGNNEKHSYVGDFLSGLDEETYLKVDSKLRDMEKVDLRVLYGDKRLKKIETGMWYVRVRIDRRCFRFLGRLDGNIFTGVSAFLKKTSKIPNKEIKITRMRLNRI